MDYAAPPALRKSEALHRRVVAFAQSSETKRSPLGDSFEKLALDIARFQMENSPGFARLCPFDKTQLKSIDQLPVVPSDVFRLTRVALHPKELDAAVFRTSGTTNDLTGEHPVRRLETKEQLGLIQAQRTLFREYGRGVVVALAPPPDGSSSLMAMMESFMRHFDGRPLLASPEGAAFSLREPGRFLIDAQGIDVGGLHRAARLAKHRAEPLYVLSTSFAMVAALEALDGEPVVAPGRTKIMITGGFKGRAHDVDEDQFRRNICRCFGIDTTQIIGEYGMTELTSQLFEQPPLAARGSVRADRTQASREPGTWNWWDQEGPAGLFFAPPWLKVRALDPTSYREVPAGEPGLAHFIDLGNVDSCLSVLTQDRIVLADGGVRLLGRAPRAPLRGCSLPFESLAFSGSGAQP